MVRLAVTEAWADIVGSEEKVFRSVSVVSCPLSQFTLHLSGPGRVFSWCAWSGMWPSLPPSSSGEFYENYLSRISGSQPLLPQLYKISGQQNRLSSLIILFHCLPSDQNRGADTRLKQSPVTQALHDQSARLCWSTLPGPLVDGGGGDGARGRHENTVRAVELVSRLGEDLLHGAWPHRAPSLGGGHLGPGHGHWSLWATHPSLRSLFCLTVTTRLLRGFLSINSSEKWEVMLSWNMMPAAPTALFSPRRKYLSLQWWKPNTLASSQTKLMSNESFDSDNIQMSLTSHR